ncbi:MAG TPA: redoxin domain-containing protein [Gemmatimonadales bacterium]|jgi:peroxiredoxin
MSAPDLRASLPTVGAPAPAFSLPSTSGAEVALTSFRGQQHVLIAFFPLAFTSTCTAEMCAFGEDFGRFASQQTVVLPISVDSLPTLREYKARHALHFDFLSDFRRDVSRAYGVLNEEKFYANRAYIIVDKLGVVRWAWQEEHNGLRRENAELLAQLAALD